MDIEMPIWNGFKSTEVIINFCQEQNLKAPNIIACTAYVD